MKTEEDELSGYLHSLRNRIELAYCCLEDEREDLLHTVLEDILQTAQLLVEKHCIADK